MSVGVSSSKSEVMQLSSVDQLKDIDRLLLQAEKLASDTNQLKVAQGVNALRETVMQRVDAITGPDTRRVRLRQWAAAKGMKGPTEFEIQGSILATYNNWWRGVGENEANGRSISAIPLKDITYRMMKMLVSIFDPKEHGDDFQSFAEKYIRAGVRKCLDENKMVIPVKIDWHDVPLYLNDLIGVARIPVGAEEPVPDASVTRFDEAHVVEPASVSTPVEEIQVAVKAPPTPSTIFAQTLAVRNTTAAAITPVTSHAPEAPTKVVPRSNGKSPKKEDKKERVIPIQEPVPEKPLPVVPQPAVVEADPAIMREQRVCEYVREHVKGGLNIWEYKDAVPFLLQAYLGDAIQNSKKFLLQGKEKVKNPRENVLERTAKELLNEAIASFDPGSGEGDRFRGHLTNYIKTNIMARYKSHA